MAVYFFDTSALVKCYVHEIGSAWVRGIVDPAAGNDIYLLRITAVEMTSAIIRRRNAGFLTVAAAASLLSDFRSDVANEFILTEVSEALLSRADALVEQYGLRAYDAVQLAAGREIHSYQADLSLPPATLVSADLELNAAAQAEGLVVEDPNSRP
ncbi:MAG: type II toxin-antitoxin system VapC family toxin [Pirellulales bacterium]